MVVEERRGRGVGDDEDSNDRFPIGMRVLAVDDDPTCLKLLETLLRHCNYHVTTTGQAITALKMLRENRDKFDLVISDVHMPDMDGFKLLELVGLEMDLPVIMLSANSDTSAVMKGITHGACDYLLKPIRIEELKNIWQHVIRRRKIDHKDHNTSGHGDECEKVRRGTSEGGLVPNTTEPADPNGKLSKKRKDQVDDDDEDSEENGHGSEDPSTQKKPRVVWSVELHRKFVAAVNQLGIDKAVPKRILDLMNVERLTRENVASHLQKYRLYLKRISSVASQQANLAAALGAKDLSYLHMGSLDGLGDFHALSGSGQLPKAALSSYQGGGALGVGRLNSPTGLGLRGLTSPGMIQLGRPQNTGNYISDLGNLQRATHPGNPHGNLLQGMPHSFELDHLQPNKPISCHGGLSSPVDDSPLFPVAQQKQLAGIGGFSDTRVGTCGSSNSFFNVSNNPLLQGHPQQGVSGGLGSQSSLTITTLNAEPFNVSVSSSPHLPDRRRCNDTWQSASPLAGYSSNSLPMDAPLNSDDLSLANIPPMSSHMEINPLNVSSGSMAMVAPLHESLMGRDLQCQTSSLGVSVQRMSGDIYENMKFSNFVGNMGDCFGLNVNYTHKQLEDPNQDCTHNQNIGFSSPLNSFFPNQGIVGIAGQSSGQNNCNRKVDTPLMGQMNSGTSFHMQQCDVGKSSAAGAINFKEDFLSEHTKLGGGFNPNSCSSFDDLMSSVIKRERDEMPLIDGADICDIFPLGTCM